MTKGAELLQIGLVAKQLENNVWSLCDLGARSSDGVIRQSMNWIIERLGEAGVTPHLQLVRTPQGQSKTARYNIIHRMGKGEQIIVLCAHYDTVSGTVGADDNASGVVALIQIVKLFVYQKISIPKGLSFEFAFFVNEEPPFFGSKAMGSYRYFKHSLPKRGKHYLVVNLDCLGYRKTEGSTAWLIRSKEDHVSEEIFGRWKSSGDLTTTHHEESGLGWCSDIRWVIGKSPAVHINDMAIMFNPNLHRATDTPETLDYEWMAKIVIGIFGVLKTIIG